MRHSVADWWTWDVPLSRGILVAAFGLAPLLVWALVIEQWIILGALVMVALVPVIIRWPVVSTFGLYALVASSLDLRFFEGSTLTKPIGVLAAAVLLAAGLVERRLGRPPTAALLWGLFMVWAALSTAWALDPGAVFKRLPSALSIFALYLVAVCFRASRKELYWLCALAVLGGVLAAATGYFFGMDADAVGNKVRAKIAIGGETSNPNTLGRLLILPLALAIAGFIGLRGSLQKAVAIGSVALVGAGIYISMSRSALVAMVAMVSVLVYRMRARWQIVTAMVILLALSAMMPDRFYHRIVIIGGAEDHSAAARFEVYKAGLEALERFGVFGAGLGNFLAASDSDVGAHNMYLAVWVDLGIIGLVMMLAAVGSHLLAAQRARSAGHGSLALTGLEAGCVGLLAVGMFSDVIWTKSFWLAWTLLTWATIWERQSDRA